jgi:hypothetical protein
MASMFLDYTSAMQLVGAWIIAGETGQASGLVKGESFVLEPDFPAEPDRAVCLFESGGNWDWESGQQALELTLAVRASKAQDARALIRVSLSAVIEGWKAATPAALATAGIQSLKVGLPAFRGHDDRKRAFMDAGLTLVLYRPFEPGVDR